MVIDATVVSVKSSAENEITLIKIYTLVLITQRAFQQPDCMMRKGKVCVCFSTSLEATR